MMDGDIEFNDPQKNLLAAPESKVLGIAGPGTGKTTVFVEKVCRAIRESERSDSAVCALTFTNATADEIRQALQESKETAAHPHFIGTIDSFLLQYVVQPYTSAFGFAPDHGVRLLTPPQTLDLHQPKQRVSRHRQAERVSIYKFDSAGGTVGAPTFRVTLSSGRTEYIDDRQILKEIAWTKAKKVWKKHGLVTHSDCTLIAAEILSDKRWGPHVGETLGGRFDFLLVDEAQDIGTLRLNALLRLSELAEMSTFIVGDPDQSIYQFRGATPEQLNGLEKEAGYTVYPLPKTYRFGHAICEAANAFSSQSNRVLEPAEDAPNSNAELIFHSWRPKDEQPFDTLLEWLSSQVGPNDTAAVLARKHATLDYVRYGRRRGATRDITPFGKGVDAFAEAVVRVNHGEYADGRKMLESLVNHYIFGMAYASSEVLTQCDLERSVWRSAIWEIYLALNDFEPDSSWDDWRVTLLENLKSLKADIPEQHSCSKSLGRQLSKRTYNERDPDEPCTLQKIELAEAESWPSQTHFMTVHGAKGLEFDVVAYVAPIGQHNRETASAAWRDRGNSEAYCIAYVACSRAKQSLGVFVHGDYEADLEEDCPHILGAFGEVSADRR